MRAQTISIVIPALNEERGIAGTLHGLAGRQAEEIVVVDGGSRDRTVEIVRGLSDVRLVESPEANRGRQMNVGARAARGDVLLFLHADVVLPPGAIDAIRRALEEDRVPGGCFQIRFPEDAPRSLHLVAWGINLRTRWFRTATGDQGIFVRRDAFEALGGFPPLPLMEDIALFHALKRRGPVAVLDARIEISPRRWLTHGVWRTVLLMYLLRVGYWIGISPATLKRYFIDTR
ncbi:MAG: TIGR04283 family arsenosugar biosynthesis glycosyltransferase [Blastocatellia bacterium]|nr:TIGR04283 family arsenosugar biosynthesis glycosyltransferase [Blastocatellia bacterium]